MTKRPAHGETPAAASAAPRNVTLDVRPLIASGGSPFEKIAAALGKLHSGEGLFLITPFLPSPLIEKLQSEGYTARPERRADGGWQTLFLRA